MLYTFLLAASCIEQIPDSTVPSENNQHFQPLAKKFRHIVFLVNAQMKQSQGYY